MTDHAGWWVAVVFCLCVQSVWADMKSYEVESDYQNGRHGIHVLTPDDYRPQKVCRVLYVLPTDAESAGNQTQALRLLQGMDAHNRYGLIIVQMGFEKEPWFGDHASDPRVRQAGYLREFVVPFVEARYCTPGTAEGRLLLGFSKSGWGAFSLLLRYPDFFGYAAAWDAPILFDDFHYGMKAVYGTPEQLALFRPDLLIVSRKAALQGRTRLVLTGEKLWGKLIPAPGGGSHTVEAHELLQREGIPHFYDNTLTAPHRWDKTWMAPTLKALMDLATAPAK